MDPSHPSNKSRRPQRALLALNLAGYAAGALTILGYGLIGLLPPMVAGAYFWSARWSTSGCISGYRA
jgi:hypothetical protein